MKRKFQVKVPREVVARVKVIANSEQEAIKLVAESLNQADNDVCNTESTKNVIWDGDHLVSDSKEINEYKVSEV